MENVSHVSCLINPWYKILKLMDIIFLPNMQILEEYKDWSFLCKSSHLSSFYLEGDHLKMTTLSSLLILATLFSLSASHGFFRGYRNSRTWGTGEQRKARTLGIARMGRQQGDDNFIEGCDIEYLVQILT